MGVSAVVLWAAAARLHCPEGGYSFVWTFPFLSKLIWLCFIKCATLRYWLENTGRRLTWTPLRVSDGNNVFFHKSDNPTHQMWFKRGKKGQSTFGCQSRFYPAFCFFWQRQTSFAALASRRCHPRHLSHATLCKAPQTCVSITHTCVHIGSTYARISRGRGGARVRRSPSLYIGLFKLPYLFFSSILLPLKLKPGSEANALTCKVSGTEVEWLVSQQRSW